MASYTCEESSICGNFQSAICFHCNRRLCLVHINEHNKIVNNVKKLSYELELTSQKINEDSINRNLIYDDILSSLNQWRTKEIEKIQHIYENHLQSIQSEKERISKAQEKLFDQLEYIRHQQDGLVNHVYVRQTIKKVREDSVQLKWDYSSNSMLKKKTSSSDILHPRSGCWMKQIVDIFSDISSIESARNNLADYIKNQGIHFKLPILVCSYLRAWYLKFKTNEKVFLLNEHILTIQKYLTYDKSKIDVLIGIQVFFYNQNIQVDKNEMMAFLLQFFLNHQCINQKQILDWYNNKDTLDYAGFDSARQLASPFIKSLSTNKTEQTVSTPAYQGFKIEIKEEPILSS